MKYLTKSKAYRMEYMLLKDVAATKDRVLISRKAKRKMWIKRMSKLWLAS